MPEGLLIFEWNERSGVEVLAAYPNELDTKYTNRTLIQIYNMAQHTRETGISWMNTDAVNLLSFYTGPEMEFFVVLLLNMLEDPEDFEDKVEDFARIIIRNIENEKYKEMLPHIYEKISNH
ncbi:MAG: hypothetical protein GF317_04115 [Candidatus Lokiarchaeota archaeon]|nr:hypothetical protein [Candidatus Lokiarchaeota archaeon]MBD3199072.1 hypothetical protein [Candidatus Lokiarchaeota archaeon]